MATHTIWNMRTYSLAFLCVTFVDYAWCQETDSSTDDDRKWIIAIASLSAMLGVLVLAIACVILYFCCRKGNNNKSGQGYGPVSSPYQQPPPGMNPTGFWGAPAAAPASMNPYGNGGYGGGPNFFPSGGGGYSPYANPRNQY